MHLFIIAVHGERAGDTHIIAECDIPDLALVIAFEQRKATGWEHRIATHEQAYQRYPGALAEWDAARIIDPKGATR